MPSVTRRQMLAAAGASTTGLAGCVSTGCRRGYIDPVEGSWPMGGGGPRQRGYAPEATGPRTGTSVGWCFQTLAENRNRDVDTPAVAMGKPSGLRRGNLASGGPGAVFLPATVRSTSVTRNHYLHTLDAATGDRRWTMDRARRTPAIAEGTVFVPGSGGRLLAVVERSGWFCRWD